MLQRFPFMHLHKCSHTPTFAYRHTQIHTHCWTLSTPTRHEHSQNSPTNHRHTQTHKPFCPLSKVQRALTIGQTCPLLRSRLQGAGESTCGRWLTELCSCSSNGSSRFRLVVSGLKTRPFHSFPVLSDWLRGWWRNPLSLHTHYCSSLCLQEEKTDGGNVQAKCRGEETDKNDRIWKTRSSSAVAQRRTTHMIENVEVS